MTRDDLLGQTLEIKEQPSRALATEAKGRILVAYGESVVWLLEAEECQTWFVSIFLSPTGILLTAKDVLVKLPSILAQGPRILA